jgi:hypothetical protein
MNEPAMNSYDQLIHRLSEENRKLRAELAAIRAMPFFGETNALREPTEQEVAKQLELIPK